MDTAFIIMDVSKIYKGIENIIYFFAKMRYNENHIRSGERGLQEGMFNIGIMELLVVLLVAFLVVGPKDLPRVAKWIARQIKKLRKLIRDIKKETGWDEFAKEFRDTKDDLQETLKEADIREELKDAAQEIEEGMKEVRDEVQDAAEEIRTEIKGGNEE